MIHIALAPANLSGISPASFFSVIPLVKHSLENSSGNSFRYLPSNFVSFSFRGALENSPERTCEIPPGIRSEIPLVFIENTFRIPIKNTSWDSFGNYFCNWQVNCTCDSFVNSFRDLSGKPSRYSLGNTTRDLFGGSSVNFSSDSVGSFS